MPLERCAKPVSSPVDQLLKRRDLQTAEDVKVKTRTGALRMRPPNPHELLN